MYDLRNVTRDFPWASVSSHGSPVEPWRNSGSNWFSELPEGWGDVIHEYLLQLDALVRRNEWDIVVVQVKEKYGSLRFYVNILCDNGTSCPSGSSDDANRFFELIDEMESETELVCCHCGTRENVRCYGGWMHYSCPECEARSQLALASHRAHREQNRCGQQSS